MTSTPETEAEAAVEVEVAPAAEAAVEVEVAPAADPIDEAAARTLALAALAEITPAATVGDLAASVMNSDGVLTLSFENRQPGYPGWFWTVSLARVHDAETTVLEVELLPGDGALLAPDWVPWAERLADYQAAQVALAAEGVSIADLEELDGDDDEDDEDGDDEDDDDDLDDVDDLDSADFDTDASPILHSGDLDGVDIDELDESDSDDDESGDESYAGSYADDDSYQEDDEDQDDEATSS